jgi:hypothetical protein
MAIENRGSGQARKRQKEIWHRLDLQNLRDDKFVYVANQILKGRFGVISPKSYASLKELAAS